jgi:hypothetical protein
MARVPPWPWRAALAARPGTIRPTGNATVHATRRNNSRNNEAQRQRFCRYLVDS